MNAQTFANIRVADTLVWRCTIEVTVKFKLPISCSSSGYAHQISPLFCCFRKSKIGEEGLKGKLELWLSQDYQCQR